MSVINIEASYHMYRKYQGIVLQFISNQLEKSLYRHLPITHVAKADERPKLQSDLLTIYEKYKTLTLCISNSSHHLFQLIHRIQDR